MPKIMPKRKNPSSGTTSPRKMPALSVQVKHVLDPEGDTILVLSNPNAPFATFDPKGVVASLVKMPPDLAKAMPVVPTTSATPSSDQLEPTTSAEVINFRLSSKHLATASAYFRAQLNGPWKDSMHANGEYTTHSYDWDETALLIVMQIIHGRGSQVPREVSIELMGKISVVVDYFQCHDSCSFFYTTWLTSRRFEQDTSNSTGREMILSLLVATVFSQTITCEATMIRIARASRSRIHSLGLPIPDSLIDEIEKCRSQLLAGAAAAIRGLRSTYDGSDASTGCNDFNCSALFTGALLIELKQKGLGIDQIEKASAGYSFDEIVLALKHFRQPTLKGMKCLYRCLRPSALDQMIAKLDKLEPWLHCLPVDSAGSAATVSAGQSRS